MCVFSRRFAQTEIASTNQMVAVLRWAVVHRLVAVLRLVAVPQLLAAPLRGT